MTQTATTTPDPLIKEQLTLLIEREVRYQLDSIIQKMQKSAQKYDIGQQSDKRSPLRNILVAATDRTASLEVIKNTIRYQIGRREGSDVWKIERDGSRFGEIVIQELDGLREDVEEILSRIEASLQPDSPVKTYLSSDDRQREVQDLHLKLAQLYLGYLVREHTALLVTRK